jgi:hypothetical protein
VFPLVLQDTLQSNKLVLLVPQIVTNVFLLIPVLHAQPITIYIVENVQASAQLVLLQSMEFVMLVHQIVSHVVTKTLVPPALLATTLKLDLVLLHVQVDIMFQQLIYHVNHVSVIVLLAVMP